MLKNKKWLFLDVGNVILNDDPGVAFVYKEIHNALLEKGFSITYEELLEERAKMFQDRDKKLVRDLILKYLSEEEAEEVKKQYIKKGFGKWLELNPFIPESKSFIEKAQQHYQLGIIANQPAECEKTLKDLGLFHLFKFVGLSDPAGLHKPDPNFYKWALEKSGAKAEESIMIGDRIDNDIKPAKSLGFTTVHLKLDPYDKSKSINKSREFMQYLPFVQKHNITMRKPESELEKPHFEANSYEELHHLFFK